METVSSHVLRGRWTSLKFAALLILGGCSSATQSDGLKREVVSGTVTLDGKPLDSASIQFIPVDPNSAGGTSEIIRGGKFEIGKDRGPIAGTYNVSISTVDLTSNVSPDEAPGEAPKPKKDPIPAKYNVKTTLKADIKAGEPNVLDYALESKP